MALAEGWDVQFTETPGKRQPRKYAMFVAPVSGRGPPHSCPVRVTRYPILGMTASILSSPISLAHIPYH
jgi:hypothetical protein